MPGAVLTLQQRDFDDLVCELRQIYVGAGVQLSVDIGRLIIERLFDGDLERWKYRGRKDVSFRKLEKHPGLPFHKSTLSRAVGIYMMSKRRGDLTAFQHVGSSHLHEIASLSEGEQDRLLESAEEEKWSTRRLRQEVAGIVKTMHSASPKVREPAFAKWLRCTQADLALRRTSADRETIESLEIEKCRELLEATRDILRESSACHACSTTPAWHCWTATRLCMLRRRNGTAGEKVTPRCTRRSWRKRSATDLLSGLCTTNIRGESGRDKYIVANDSARIRDVTSNVCFHVHSIQQ